MRMSLIQTAIAPDGSMGAGGMSSTTDPEAVILPGAAPLSARRGGELGRRRVRCLNKMLHLQMAAAPPGGSKLLMRLYRPHLDFQANMPKVCTADMPVSNCANTDTALSIMGMSHACYASRWTRSLPMSTSKAVQ